MTIENISGGVTAPIGYLAASAKAGIKYKDRTDMALIYSTSPCEVAGAFTQNIVKAAPVVWDKMIVDSNKKAQAIVVNSGIANACTGSEGMGYCEETAKACAKELKLQASEVLLGSTGVIGMQLPMDKVLQGVDQLAKAMDSSEKAGNEAAKAIMTTDTNPKEIAVSFEIAGKKVTVGGMAKGSGMIHPNMCTMLAYITTDAVISKEALQKALSEDVCDTYNMISVDGDTSTNDTVLLLANGLAENQEILAESKEFDVFKEALHIVNEYLAKEIARDGEGATALFTVEVYNANTKEQAAIIAKSVVCSNLTKTAIAGHDANWGRILCAMGYSGADFNPDNVDLFFESAAGKIQIMESGVGCSYDEAQATKILSEQDIVALIDLKQGKEKAIAWGCDLTYDYIRINADYRS